MFIGREQELNTLNEWYKQPQLSMVVITGRRRIGKSTLITEFIKDKKAIFYTATKIGASRNLEFFSRQVIDTLDPAYLNATFPTVEAVFDFINQKITHDKLILVIDELPYWAQADEGFLSIIQKYMDTVWHDKNLMIILCGSSLSFMENKVLSEKSPLFGRRSAQIKLEAFHYRDSAKFVPNYTYEEKAICYGVTGGVAKYLSLFQPNLSLDDNIKRLFFRTDGYLYDETRNLLVQEFSDITLINNIIEQIAAGETSLNIIASKVKELEPTVLYSLKKLIDVGLVEKRTCITDEKNKKKIQYVLKDHMFKFWYEFIPKATSVIEMGQGELYYDRIVKDQLHFFMGSVFEDMCRYFTLEQGIQGSFGNFITKAGNWWGIEEFSGKNGERIRQSTDIDIVAISDIDKTAVIGECKFKNEKIDREIYETLVRRAGLIYGKYQVIQLLFFSLSGYTSWFDEQNLSNVRCFALEDLYLSR